MPFEIMNINVILLTFDKGHYNWISSVFSVGLEGRGCELLF